MDLYPEQNSTSFQHKIIEWAKKYEFTEKSITNNKNEAFPYQQLVVDYLDDKSPYRGLLVYYGLGAGKTFLSLLTAEKHPTKPKFIISPARLKNTFINDYRKFFNKEIDLNLYNFISYNSPTLSKNVKEMETQTAFQNNKNAVDDVMEQIKPSSSSNPFDNSVVIIDEVHTLLGNMISGNASNAKSLRDILLHAKNCKILCMSGTPIDSDPYQSALLFSILRGDPDLFGKTFEDFNNWFIDRKTNKIINKAVYQDRISGLVAYYKGLKDDEMKILPKIISNEIVDCPMGTEQWKEYMYARKIELDDERRAQFLKKEFVKAVMVKPARKGGNIYKSQSRQISNYSVPEYVNKEIRDFNEKVKSTNITKSAANKMIKELLNKIKKEDLTTSLERFSGKMNKMLSIITDSKNFHQKIFIFSFFIVHGIGIIQRILDAHDYKEYIPKLDASGNFDDSHLDKKDDYKRYIIMSGDIDERLKNALQNRYNQKDNADGKFIRILLGTDVISKGVNLTCVRHVIIMEAQFFLSTIEQIIGRARRTYSHNDLPQSERTIKVYTLMATQPDGVNVEKILSPDITTVDKMIYNKAVSKDELNQQFLLAIKETAINCLVHKEYNEIETCRKCNPTDVPIYPPSIKQHIIEGSRCDQGIVLKVTKIKHENIEYYVDQNGIVYESTPNGYERVSNLIYDWKTKRFLKTF